MQTQKFDPQELQAYLSGYWLSDLSNFCSYLAQCMPDINWLGFYLSDGKVLRLGPFVGNPACLEIAFGKGVCGTAFAQEKVLIVDDVDSFPGHIRCDSRSRSELVAPFYVGGKIRGVLDIDSPSLARFTKADQDLVQSTLSILSENIIKDSRFEFGQL